MLSTETFLKTHSKYVEVERHNCPKDYDRKKIIEALAYIDRWPKITEKEIKYLNSIGLTAFAQKAESTNSLTR